MRSITKSNQSVENRYNIYEYINDNQELSLSKNNLDQIKKITNNNILEFDIILGFDDFELSEEQANKINSILLERKAIYRLEPFEQIQLEEFPIKNADILKKDLFSNELVIFDSYRNQTEKNYIKKKNESKQINVFEALGNEKELEEFLQKKRRVNNKNPNNNDKENVSFSDFEPFIEKYKKISNRKFKNENYDIKSNKKNKINKKKDESNSNLGSIPNLSLNKSDSSNHLDNISKCNKKIYKNNKEEFINLPSFKTAEKNLNTFINGFKTNTVLKNENKSLEIFKHKYFSTEKNNSKNKDSPIDYFDINEIKKESKKSEELSQNKISDLYKKENNLKNKNHENDENKSCISFENGIKSKTINKDFKYIKYNNTFINVSELNEKRVLRDRNKLCRENNLKSTKSSNVGKIVKSCKSPLRNQENINFGEKDYITQEEANEMFNEKFSIFEKRLNKILKEKDKNVSDLFINLWNCVEKKIKPLKETKSIFKIKKDNYIENKVNHRNDNLGFLAKPLKKRSKKQKISNEEINELNLKLNPLINNAFFIKKFKELFSLKENNGDYNLNLYTLPNEKFIKLKAIVDEIILSKDLNYPIQEISTNNINNLTINNEFNLTQNNLKRNILDDSNDISSSLSDDSKSILFNF